MNSLAKRLRYAREQAGHTQSALARLVGVKPQTIQLIEAGKVVRPRHLLDIARALDVSAQWLSTGEGRTDWQVREPAAHYDSGLALTPEAQAFARQWMALPKAQRDAVSAMMRALTQPPRKP